MIRDSQFMDCAEKVRLVVTYLLMAASLFVLVTCGVFTGLAAGFLTFSFNSVSYAALDWYAARLAPKQILAEVALSVLSLAASAACLLWIVKGHEIQIF